MTTGELRDALLAGGVAILPTDTVYGLAAALDSPAGVAALYALKGRSRSQPCQVLLYAIDLLDEAIAPLDARTASAVRTLLPGPVTCLVPDPGGRYEPAAGESPGAVGIRAPRMDPPLDLDIPLVATSANKPGGRDPAVVGDVPDAIRAGAGAVLDLGRLTGRASSVVDLRAVGGGGPARLVRAGADAPAVRHRLTRLGVQIAPAPAPDGG